MPRSIFLPVLGICGLVLAGCSKKEAAPEKTADATQPSAAQAAAPQPAPSAPSADSGADIQFRLPGGEATSTPAADAGVATSEPGKQVLQMPEMLLLLPPFYPLSKRMEGIEGRVDLGLVVEADGTVSNVEVLGSTAPEFNQYAVDAAKHWRFRPAMVDGKPVRQGISYPVPFVSEYGSAPAPGRSPLIQNRIKYVDGMFYTFSPEGKHVPVNIKDPIVLQRSDLMITFPGAAEKNLRTLIKATISTEGQVVDPTVSESSGNKDFDEVMLMVVRYWQFVPRIRDGVAQTAVVHLPMVFNSNKE